MHTSVGAPGSIDSVLTQLRHFSRAGSSIIYEEEQQEQEHELLEQQAIDIRHQQLEGRDT